MLLWCLHRLHDKKKIPPAKDKNNLKNLLYITTTKKVTNNIHFPFFFQILSLYSLTHMLTKEISTSKKHDIIILANFQTLQQPFSLKKNHFNIF